MPEFSHLVRELGLRSWPLTFEYSWSIASKTRKIGNCLKCQVSFVYTRNKKKVKAIRIGLTFVFFFLLESILDPTYWAIVTEERNTCCFVARDHELFKLRQGDSVCSLQNVSFEKEFKSIIMISVSYNHKFLALYTNNGILWLGSSDLKSKYCEFDTNRSEKPKQIEW